VLDADFQPLRIAVACAADPTDAQAFSGTPAALLTAIGQLGYEDVPIAATAGRAQPIVQKILAASLLRPADVQRAIHAEDRGAELRRAVRTAQSRLVADPRLARVRSLAARRIVARSPSLTGAVQFGTDFRLPAGVPYVTYDDQTVVQAARAYGYSWTTVLTDRDMRRLVARQKRTYEDARACCATSHWAAASIVDDYGIDRSRVHVVGVGAAQTVDQPAERDWSDPRFLLVGKDWERKNGQRVLDAFVDVRATHPTATLDLVGNHPELEVDGVTGHGFLNPNDPRDRRRVIGLYQQATCFVLPSLHEPSALSYIEAAAAGVGAVGTASGGAKTLIGDAGIVVEPLDDAALRDAMGAFCDPVFAQSTGAAARARSTHFTWQAVARRLIAALTGARGDFL